MKIEIEREEDGRWIAEVNDLPGVLAYGKTRDEAIAKVEALALHPRSSLPRQLNWRLPSRGAPNPTLSVNDSLSVSPMQKICLII